MSLLASMLALLPVVAAKQPKQPATAREQALTLQLEETQADFERQRRDCDALSGAVDQHMRTIFAQAEEIARLRRDRDHAMAVAFSLPLPSPPGAQAPSWGELMTPAPEGLRFAEVNRMLAHQQAQNPHVQALFNAHAQMNAVQHMFPGVMEFCDCTPRGGRAGAMVGLTPLAEADR